ncbi:MAG: MFS transporter [Planctomycetota bacterium]|nr:MFS transporter [Planctomycetota bacterium]
MQNDKSRTVMGLAFLTVFLDMVGFSILFPLFPDMLRHYIGEEGTASFVGRIAETLGRWVGAEDPLQSLAVHAFFGGLLGSIYSLCQFLMAPIWGSLSDRFGRRRILLITLFGTVLGYVAWIFADTFLLLLLSRLLGGIMAGNISTASAAVADVTTERNRAHGMGMIGAGIGLGFVFGPAIGGISASWDVLQQFPEWAHFGLHPFSGPAFLALCMALFNFVWAAKSFPETLDPKNHAGEGERTLRPWANLKKLGHPGLRRANMAYFFYFLVFGSMEFTLTFLASDRLQYGPRQNMWMFVFVGLMIALIQGGFVRRLAPKIGEVRLAFVGMAATLPGLVMVGMTQTTGMLYGGLFFLAAGSALVMPCLSALVSRYAPVQHQGLALGVFRSLGSLSRTIGPLLGGLLFYAIAPWAPYFLGAAALVWPLMLARALPQPEPLAPAEEPESAQ